VNILRRLALKAAETAVRNLTIREPDDVVWKRLASDSGEIVSDEGVLGLSAVWGCVNLLSGTIASLPLNVYKRDRDGRRDVSRDHALYRVLHDSPNYDQTAVDFWEFITASIELWGNAYARIERAAGKVTGLHPVNPALVSVRRLQNGTIEYRWAQEGRYFVESDRTMLHIRGFGGDPLGGMSTLRFGRNTFGLARAAQRAAGSMFRNGMRPSVQVSFEKWLSKEQRDLAESVLTERYLGAMNTGRPYISEGGSKIEAISINPVDAQMLETLSLTVEEICRFFGVPPFMIGHTEKSTSWGSGLEQQTLGFQKFTLRPA
jgi:HK97 family phage portal protein